MFVNQHNGVTCYIKPGREKAQALLAGQAKVQTSSTPRQI